MTDPRGGKYPRPEDWVSTVDPATGSEFGGVPGHVQPLPHDMLNSSVHEVRNYIVSIPADEVVQSGVDQRGVPLYEFASTYDVPPTQMVKR